jgi:choline dehydrogenase-like flavoprotein
MLIDTRERPLPQSAEVDVCIIGAGPAGLAVARELSESGQTVLVLESGFLEPDAGAATLNLGWAHGPIVERHPLYLASSRHRGFGGSQNAWGGWCTLLNDLDFERREWVPHTGWPLPRSELSPYLERAYRLSGLHTSAARPLPEAPCFGDELDRVLYHFAPNRQTLGQVLYQGLSAADGITIYLGANAVRLECDSAKRRVRTVLARTLRGDELAIAARNTVLAAGGIENPRLLIANGLGNQSDLVGRFFMEHPHVLVGSATLPASAAWTGFDERFDAALGHGVMAALRVPSETQRRLRLLNATVQLWPEDGETLGTRDGLRARLMLRAEQAPNPESRVTLSDETDPLGMAVAQVEWAVTPLDWESVCTTAELVSGALERHGSAKVDVTISRDTPWPGVPSNTDHYQPWGCHHVGTTRMSASPGSGVVDTDARVHGMENLFVVGSSVFPTEGYANPTVTIIALALRTAEFLKRLV